jgi:hypothetical protein
MLHVTMRLGLKKGRRYATSEPLPCVIRHFFTYKVAMGCGERILICARLSGKGCLDIGGHNDVCVLKLNQSGADPLLEFRQNPIHLFSRFNELDFDGKLIGNLKNVGGMQTVLRAKSSHAFYHGSAGNTAVKQIVEDAAVNGNPVVFSSIVQVKSNFHSLSRGQHSFLSAWPRGGQCAGMRSQTPKD